MRRAAAGAAILLLAAGPALAQWTRGAPGGTWAKTAFFRQNTSQEFSATGERRERIDQGIADSRVLFTDFAVGLHRRLDLWLQVPYMDLRFENLVDTLQSTGIGDVRGWLRFQAISGSWPVTVRTGFKAPVGFNSVDVLTIPVGDGQWDLEFWGEVGHSFWPFPAYWVLWLGYRVRLENEEFAKDPGGEYTFLTEAGWNPTNWTLAKVTLDGFVGRNWVVENVQTGFSRRLLTLQLTGGVRAGFVWLEAGGRLPLAGRNITAGAQLVVALSFSAGP